MKRSVQLDGVRGVAILLVLIWHYWCCQIAPTPRSFASDLASSLSLSWSGADLFFVLSGFLISGSLFDHKGAGNFFQVFYLRRACRIFPLYFLILGLFVAFWSTPFRESPAFRALLGNPFPFWSYASFTQSYLMGARGNFGPDWLGVSWSLAIEEQFYVVVPLLIFLFSRRVLAVFLVASILGSVCLRFASPGFHAFVSTPWRADSILSGVLLAMAVRWPPFLSVVRSSGRSLLGLLVILLVGVGALTMRPNCLGGANHLWLAGLYSTLVLIAFLGGEPILGNVLSSPALVWLGRRSFGIYLIHQVVGGLMHAMILHQEPRIRSVFGAFVTFLSLVTTLALAALSHRYLESPFRRLGDRFRYAVPSAVGGTGGQSMGGR